MGDRESLTLWWSAGTTLPSGHFPDLRLCRKQRKQFTSREGSIALGCAFLPRARPSSRGSAPSYVKVRERKGGPSGKPLFFGIPDAAEVSRFFRTLPHFPLLRFRRRRRRAGGFRETRCGLLHFLPPLVRDCRRAGRMLFSRKRKRAAVEVTGETATKMHRSLIRAERKVLILFFVQFSSCTVARILEIFLHTGQH